jgi:excisionase family DNA binding protein
VDMSSYLKLPEVAHRLGVSEKTARRYIKSGDLPSVFIGNSYRIEPNALTEYVERSRGQHRRVEEISGSPKDQSRPSPEALEEADGEVRPMKTVSPEELKSHIAHMEQLKEHRKLEMEALAHERIYDPQAWSFNMELADEGLTRRYEEERVFEFVEQVNAGGRFTSDEVRRLCRRFVGEFEALKHQTHEARVVAQTAHSRTEFEAVKRTI